MASPSSLPDLTFTELVAELVDLRERVAMLERRDVSTCGDLPGRSWYTIAEAADRLGCSTDAVRMRAKRGRLVTRRQGRTVYVSAASVEDLS
jgi:excisionase family DNA binding protein